MAEAHHSHTVSKAGPAAGTVPGSGLLGALLSTCVGARAKFAIGWGRQWAAAPRGVVGNRAQPHQGL